MSNESKQIAGLIVVLILIANSLFAYKHFWLKIPLMPKAEETVWLLEAKMLFQGKQGKAKIQLSIPDLQPNYTIVNESIFSPKYGVSTKKEDGNRNVVWTKRRVTGRENLYYRITLKPRKRVRNVHYEAPENNENLTLTAQQTIAADTIIKEVREKSSDTASFTTLVIQMLNKTDNQNASLLLGNDTSDSHVALMTQVLLKKANIVSTPLQGIFITKKPNLTIVPWLAVKSDKDWLYFNPANGEESLPENFLVWHIGLGPLYHVEGGKYAKFTFSYTPQRATTQVISEEAETAKIMEFSLSVLPLAAQKMFLILLTIPIGALVILIFRNYIGLPTFGTFMPVLIAIAFLNMQLFWGLFLFVFIVTFGLLVRFYLEKLYLLMVPRLASILVAVVMFIIWLSVILHKLGLQGEAVAALFPIVILTMTIERLCTIWDEKGASVAIMRGFNSLFVAVAAYFFMRNTTLQSVLFNYPELNLNILALILLLGQYRGYRLTELKRFSSFKKFTT